MSKIKPIHNIKGCARCGGDHDQLEITAFTNGTIDDYGWFAICPELQEPILVKIDNSPVIIQETSPLENLGDPEESNLWPWETLPDNSSINATKKCDGDHHIWFWLSASLQDESEPAANHLCQCGSVEWQDRQK